MTIFEKAGYTKDTKFKVLRNYKDLKAGDIVTLDEDNGYYVSWFITEDCREGDMYLPGCGPIPDLEVISEE